MIRWHLSYSLFVGYTKVIKFFKDLAPSVSGIIDLPLIITEGFPKFEEVKDAFQLVQQTVKSKTLTQEEIISAINSAAALKKGENK